MTRCVRVCHGWACELNMRCPISDFNHRPQPGTWTRHFQSPQVGHHCPHIVHEPQDRPIGHGSVETAD